MSEGDAANAAPDSLAGFLAARLDEDEAAANAAPGAGWRSFGEDDIAGASVYDEQWLLLSPARYDHDNALSNKPGASGPQYIQRHRDDLTAHIARHDPARVLREVTAKRAILDEHAPGYPVTYPKPSGQPTCSVCDEGGFDVEPVQWPCPTIRHLAAVYSDHPGYRAEWKL